MEGKEENKEPQQQAYRYNIVFVGARRSGKTSLFSRMVSGSMAGAYRSFFEELVVVPGTDTRITCRFCDLPGENEASPAYLSGANVVVVVYDAAIPESAQEAKKELDRARKAAPKARTVVVANKCDLLKQGEIEGFRKAESTKWEDGLFFAASAKSGLNVKEMTGEIARVAYDNRETPEPAEEQERTVRILLVGDKGCGKTSLAQRFSLGIFRSVPKKEGPAPVIAQEAKIGERTVKIEVLDSAEDSMARGLDRVDAVVVVYDVAFSNQVPSLKKWMNTIEKSARKTVVIAAFGSKCDRIVGPFYGLRKLQEFAGDMIHKVVSAKNGFGVFAAFRDVAKSCLENRNNDIGVEKEMDAGSCSNISKCSKKECVTF